jgi:hypothetical protein
MRTSESIAKISAALAKAQSEMKSAAFDAINPHFKSRYASLSSIIEASRQILSANNIAVVQGTSVANGKVQVETMLTHSSGEFISETLSMSITKDTPQAVGSAITYARRYGLSSMICISADEDDDAEATKPVKGPQAVKVDSKKIQKGKRPKEERKPHTKAPISQINPRVSKIRKIFNLSAKLGHTPEQMRILIGAIIGIPGPIKESADIPDDKLDEIIEEFSAQLDQRKEAA